MNRVRSAVFRSEKRPSAGRSTVCRSHKQENAPSSPVCGSKKCHIRPRSPVWRSRQGPSEARSPVFCSGKVSSAPCSPVWRTASQGRAALRHRPNSRQNERSEVLAAHPTATLHGPPIRSGQSGSLAPPETGAVPGCAGLGVPVQPAIARLFALPLASRADDRERRLHLHLQRRRRRFRQ